MSLREAAELAIEALQEARSVFNGEGDTIGGCGWCHAPSYGPCEPHCDKDRAVKALRAALAEDVAETNFGNIPQAVDSKEADHIPDATKMMSSVREDRTVEPVAWLQIGVGDHEGTVITTTTKPKTWNPDWWRFEPLYTAPPKREPLTEEEIKAALISVDSETKRLPPGFRDFARAIERAHGIGGEE